MDAKLRDALRIEIDSLLRSLGITAIYVTHDQGEAMALGDRIVVMNIGKAAQIGTPRDIYFKPQNQFVADFIGTINRLSCSIHEGNLVLPGKPIPLAQALHVQTRGREMIDVFFRPEHATVVEAGMGHLSATILATFFMGDRTRLIVKGSTPEHLTIEASGHLSFDTGRQMFGS